jgi:hypothetical protein
MARKSDSHSVGSVFLAVALLLAALTFAEAASFFAGPAQARSIMAGVAALSKQDPDGMQSYLEQTKKTAEALKKQNAFVKQPPKENPVKQVDGILGSELLIGDKWYKTGDKIGDATVIAIESTQVIVEWDGKQTSFTPMAGASKGRSGPPEKPEPGLPPAKGPAVAKLSAQPKVVGEVQIAAAPEDDDPLAWMGVKLPEKMRAMLLEKWNSMSEEEKEKAKEEWNNMSDEQKQKAAESFERMQ